MKNSFSIKMVCERPVTPNDIFSAWEEMSKILHDIDNFLVAAVDKQYALVHMANPTSTLNELTVDVEVRAEDAVVDSVESSLAIFVSTGRQLIIERSSTINDEHDIAKLAGELTEIATKYENENIENRIPCVCFGRDELPGVIVRLRTIEQVDNGSVSFSLSASGEDVVLSKTKKLGMEDVTPIEEDIQTEGKGIFLLCEVPLNKDKTWSAKLNGENETLEILHKEWLYDFQNRKIPVYCGDAIEAEYRHVRNPKKKKGKYSILNIIDKREAKLIFQEALDFSGENKDKSNDEPNDDEDESNNN